MGTCSYQQYILETPIAYDDSTNKKIGKLDKKSGTTWEKTPPTNATPDKLYDWVQQQIYKKVMTGNRLGHGATKQAEFNDNKTIFKYVYDEDTELGNQIDIELKVMERSKQFESVFPKLYQHGKFWMIQEKCKVFNTITDFNKFMGIPAAIVLLDFIAQQDSWEIEWILKNNFLAKYQKMTPEAFKTFFMKKAKEDFDTPATRNRLFKNMQRYNQIFKHKDLKKIVEMYIFNDLKFRELRIDNLGINSKGRLVCIDWGVKDS